MPHHETVQVFLLSLHQDPVWILLILDFSFEFLLDFFYALVNGHHVCVNLTFEVDVAFFLDPGL